MRADRLRPGDRIAIEGRTLTIRRITRRWPWSRDVTLLGSLHGGHDTDTLYRVAASRELEAYDPTNPYEIWPDHEDA